MYDQSVFSYKNEENIEFYLHENNLINNENQSDNSKIVYKVQMVYSDIFYRQ